MFRNYPKLRMLDLPSRPPVVPIFQNISRKKKLIEFGQWEMQITDLTGSGVYNCIVNYVLASHQSNKKINQWKNQKVLDWHSYHEWDFYCERRTCFVHWYWITFSLCTNTSACGWMGRDARPRKLTEHLGKLHEEVYVCLDIGMI